jgi:hypothetical protein
VENAAAEGPEVLQSALGIRALDSGDTTAVVTAGEEPLYRIGDPLEAELAEPLGELGLVAGGELREVRTEEPLERAHSPLVVGAGGRRTKDSANWSATKRKTAQESVTHFLRGCQYHQ